MAYVCFSRASEGNASSGWLRSPAPSNPSIFPRRTLQGRSEDRTYKPNCRYDGNQSQESGRAPFPGADGRGPTAPTSSGCTRASATPCFISHDVSPSTPRCLMPDSSARPIGSPSAPGSLAEPFTNRSSDRKTRTLESMRGRAGSAAALTLHS